MTPLERAARALHEHWLNNYQFGFMEADATPWDDLSDAQKAYGLGQVRAVLSSIRHPDMDTALAGAPHITRNMKDNDDYFAAKDSFAAMIDHILAGGEADERP